MRTLVHLSDLHFGRVDAALVAPLIKHIHALCPDLVVVSGDLTQRARSVEFIQAQEFLAALPMPQLVVPGNHDIPMHNPLRRFIDPLKKYQRYICATLQPTFSDSEIAVVGINTARSFTIKDGRINEAQLADVDSFWRSVDPAVTKIVVTHHPFDLPGAVDPQKLIDRATHLMPMLTDLKVDLLLAGHHHVAHSANTAANYPRLRQAALVIQAGTATSTRGRGEANSFNVIRIDRHQITVERHDWMPTSTQFQVATTSDFFRDDAGWMPRKVEETEQIGRFRSGQ